MRLSKLFYLYKYFGFRWLVYRAWYRTQRKLKLLKLKTPPGNWEDYVLEEILTSKSPTGPGKYYEYRRAEAPNFFFSPDDRKEYGDLLRNWDKADNTPLEQSDKLIDGIFSFFHIKNIKVGFPPNWHKNHITGEIAPSDVHWSQLGNYDYGDIKVIWDLNRFGFVYDLVRAYWRTGSEKYPRLFWDLVENWRNENPPNLGPNWMCGQEISFRSMAWIFGMYGFLVSSATTPKRVARLAEMLYASGERIKSNINYALSQNNNHGISEAMGLWTIGTLFPEFPDSERWQSKGEQFLESLAEKLIYEDGSFSQYSLNYHRLMLQDYLWVLRLGEINNWSFSSNLENRIRKAVDFLVQLQDEQSGRVPRYGSFDGSLVLPLTNCDYQDFRGTAQAAHFYFENERCFEAGPWDEELFWLFGPEVLETDPIPPGRSNFKASSGGYYTLRNSETFGLFRCGSFQYRPGQADMLHFDLWWKGLNIAFDPGTYSYNPSGKRKFDFSRTRYHNTVAVDEKDQMDRAGKFLWLPWLEGNLTKTFYSDSGELDYLEGFHDGYQRLSEPVYHKRSLIRIGEYWIVMDNLLADSEHKYRLHWNLGDFSFQRDFDGEGVTLQTEGGKYQILSISDQGRSYSLVRGDEESWEGWYAPYYYSCEPALSFDVSLYARSARIVTLFGPNIQSARVTEESLLIRTDKWVGEIELTDSEEVHSPSLEKVSISGSIDKDRVVK